MWLVEFITGLLCLFIFTLNDDIKIVVTIAFFDIILSFVLIPGAYILNTEVMKAHFIQNGWFSSLRDLFAANRVQPVVNNEAANNS